MEITINIPKNEYTTPTECRQEVVQAICDAFLRRCAFSDFRPHSSGPYRRATLYVGSHKGGDFYGFNDEPDFFDGMSYKVRGCEVKAAIEALIKAGYHMWTYYAYNDYNCKEYRLSSQPFLENTKGAREVFTFEDIID